VKVFLEDEMDTESSSAVLRASSHDGFRMRRPVALVIVFLVSMLYSVFCQAQIVSTSELAVERRGHTATLLEDGKVLIVGGDNAGGVVSQAEIFDPVSRTSIVAASILARTDHTATRLSDGRVLVVGGRNQTGSLTSSDIYNPLTATFTAGPSLTTPRSGHTATVLTDGRILIAGGDASGSAELYNPATQSFSLVTGSMNTARKFHSSILASSGQVLIVGGVNAQNTVLNTAEVFDPPSQSFYLPPTDMQTPRALATLKLLPDGKVQIIGGDTDLSMEVFDPITGIFNAKALLPPNADLLGPTLSTQSRAALFSTSISQDPLLQNALTPEQLALLDRADQSITELPSRNQALISGGINSAGQILNSVTLLKSSSASITTDKNDYAPGQIVTITGSGFQPNERVNIYFHEFPEEYPDIFLSATANQQGNFVIAEFAPQQIDIGRIFTLTAIGQSSGVVAQTAFKDDNVQNNVTVGGNDTFTAGGSTTIAYRISANNGDGQNGCNAADGSPAIVTINTPAGVTATPGSLTFTQCGQLNAQNVAFTSNAPGNYAITVSVSDSGTGTYNTNPAGFTLHVLAAADSTAPTINCTVPDQTVWYGTDVTVNCTASDSGSGLANPSDASFSLLTSVAAVTETTSAATNTKTVCDNDSNCATAGPYTFKVDKKAPQQTSCDSPDGLWHNDNVTLHCTYTDGGSGPASQQVSLSTNVAAGTETSNAVASANGAQACDSVGNCAPSPADIPGNRIDRKNPTVSCGSADTSWHANDQSVACTVTDGGSGPASQTVTLSTNVASGTETDSAYTNSQQICDAANNCATVGPVGPFKIDKKAPQQISCDSPDGLWHANNVTLNCHYSDGGSGPLTQDISLTTNVPAGTETANAVASASGAQACDNVGNCAASPVNIAGNKIDRKAPQQTSCDSPDGFWHNDNVTLHCTYTDGGSGPSSQHLSLTTNVPAGTETANASASANGAQACDNVGNCTASPADIAGNKIDRKAPTNIIFVGTISNGASYYFGFVPPAPTCMATDGGSGLQSCVVTGYGTNVGSHTLTASAMDNVRNSSTTTVSYTVLAWTLHGFYQPIDMSMSPIVWNIVKGGSTVPLKFEVFAGPTELTDTAVVKSLTSTTVACSSGMEDSIEDLSATGGTSLRYDTTGGQFIYNWQTPKKPGVCYKATMTTQDDSSLSAYFKLK
jgi:hypothetical protein